MNRIKVVSIISGEIFRQVSAGTQFQNADSKRRQSIPILTLFNTEVVLWASFKKPKRVAID
ncbi:MAG TPA: hypothetical protein DDZ90_23820 [Planctomycetaceae bacterium]|nr:hypothetical protein [Gimesia sp.]HBL46416.1 hypothetical protein [Planctomycetaceae bacterium]